MGFADDFQKFRVKVEKRNGAIVRKVGLTLHGRIVERCPVDTGRARANNQIEIKTKPMSTLIETDKAGDKTKRRASLAMAGYTLGDDIWIANNVAYIIPLEYGHSKQRPEGMFRVSIQDILTAWPGLVSQVKQEVR